MSAFVFLILALGYLHASEAKEQLSLTDFLLDFLLSLWVPQNYVPSKYIRSFPDPAVREQMISVEKSRTALDNYIQHLLRYAKESSYNLGEDPDDVDQIPDSSMNQPFGTGLPINCNTVNNYDCDYSDSDQNQVLYTPYPGIMPNQIMPNQIMPNQIMPSNGMNPNQINPFGLPTQGPMPNQEVPDYPSLLPNPGRFPNQGMFSKGHANAPPYHSPHSHQTQYIPGHMHSGNYQPDHYHQAPPEVDDNDSFADYDIDQGIIDVPDSIGSFLPALSGQPSNIFSIFTTPDGGDPDCDPDMNSVVYNPTYCPPPEMFSGSYYYHGMKRNADQDAGVSSRDIFGSQYQALYTQPLRELARKILYLAKEKKKGGVVKTRLDRRGLEQQLLSEVNDVSPASISTRNINTEDKSKSEDLTDKAVETRIFEEWYLPNYIDDLLRRTARNKQEPGPSAPAYDYTSQYYNDQFSDFTDAYVANQIVDKKLNPGGLLFKDLKISPQSRKLRGDATPPRRSLPNLLAEVTPPWRSLPNLLADATPPWRSLPHLPVDATPPWHSLPNLPADATPPWRSLPTASTIKRESNTDFPLTRALLPNKNVKDFQ